MPDFDVAESYRSGRADDEFDLPRYQPRLAQRDMRQTNAYGHISSPNGPRINPAYAGSMGHTLPSFQGPTDNSGLSNAASQRQQASRLSQILDVDVFSGAGSLARSTSLSGMSRARHGNQPPDDVERAFVDSSPSNSRAVVPPQQSPPSQSFYNSSITYQSPPASSGDPGRVLASDQLPYPTRRTTTTQQISQTSTPYITLPPKSSSVNNICYDGFFSDLGPYHDSSYSAASSYDAYGGGSDTHRSPHSHAPSPPMSLTSPPQTIALQQSPSITQAYHPMGAAFSTPPADALPPSSTLPDASNSLRPYAYSSHQQPNQYRSSGGSNPATPSYPSRHQSPQMYAYSPRAADEGANNARPMSIDGRSSFQPQPPPPPPRVGFRRVRGMTDLRPRLNVQPPSWRADPSGNGMFLSVSPENASAMLASGRGLVPLTHGTIDLLRVVKYSR